MSIDFSKILIVDDSAVNRELLFSFLISFNYEPLVAIDGVDAMKKIKEVKPDLILLDVMMPRMGGIEFLDKFMGMGEYKNIPVIMVSANDEKEKIVKCIENGADDYLSKPIDPVLLKARVKNSLLKKQALDNEIKTRDKVENFNKILQNKVKEQVDKISAAQKETIFALAKLAESRDNETGGHLLRLRDFSKIIAEEMQELRKLPSELGEHYPDDISTASPLHDIGKVGIPDSILQKSGKLTPDEFEIMKKHTTIGADALSEVNKQHPGNEFVSLAIEIAAGHHEKWDGSGYPNGIKGENIPLSARILALADVYDALTSKRCYKDAFSHEKSRKIIIEGKGSHFDPMIVDIFMECEKEFIEVKNKYQDK